MTALQCCERRRGLVVEQASRVDILVVAHSRRRDGHRQRVGILQDTERVRRPPQLHEKDSNPVHQHTLILRVEFVPLVWCQPPAAAAVAAASAPNAGGTAVTPNPTFLQASYE